MDTTPSKSDDALSRDDVDSLQDFETLKRTLTLPREMRDELKSPLGLLLEGPPEEVVKRLKDILKRDNPVMLASVGDFTSKNVLQAGLELDIVVVDHRVMRVKVEPLDLSCRMKIQASNPAGTVDSDSWRALQRAITLKRGVAVIVEGEEDLLVLPLIALMPLGSVIIYGQPNRGVVYVKINKERKKWVYGFMNRMERVM